MAFLKSITVTLTGSGTTLHVVIDKIVALRPAGTGSGITSVTGTEVTIEETPAEVGQLIEDA